MMATGVASIEVLQKAFGDLRRALDAQDASLINDATKAVRGAVDAVRAQGAWHIEPQLRKMLESLVPTIESARVRVSLASDDVRGRIAMLADRGAENTALTYRR